VWATIGHGVLNEVYWPSTGEPQLRDLTFYLIGSAEWIDLKRVRRCTIATPAPFLPLPTIVHRGDDYALELEFLPDPNRDVLMIRYRLTGPYRVAVIAAPHMDVDGRDNVAWVDGALFAHRRRRVLCVTADQPLANPSAGYVGSSDGWQDLTAHAGLTYGFTKAGPGNVALTAELTATSGVLAIGFATSARGAWTLAQSSIADGFETARSEFVRQWAQ
jgi:glucoamylase